MPDMERADQILALGRVLSRIPTGNKHKPYMNTPPPIIGMWATELHDKYGVRVHADLATEELVRVQSPAGNHGPLQSVTKNTPAPADGGPDVKKLQSAHEMLMQWLRAKDPAMAARVEKAQGDPMASALLFAEIQRENPEILEMSQKLMDDIEKDSGRAGT